MAALKCVPVTQLTNEHIACQPRGTAPQPGSGTRAPQTRPSSVAKMRRPE